MGEGVTGGKVGVQALSNPWGESALALTIQKEFCKKKAWLVEVQRCGAGEVGNEDWARTTTGRKTKGEALQAKVIFQIWAKFNI